MPYFDASLHPWGTCQEIYVRSSVRGILDAEFSSLSHMISNGIYHPTVHLFPHLGYLQGSLFVFVGWGCCFLFSRVSDQTDQLFILRRYSVHQRRPPIVILEDRKDLGHWPISIYTCLSSVDAHSMQHCRDSRRAGVAYAFFCHES